MGASTLGELKVILGADPSDLEKGLGAVQARFATFGKALASTMAIAAAGVTAAAVAIGSQIKSAIDNADKVNKLSQSAGMTTEEFTRLRYAADLADVSQETLGKSASKLSKAMIDVAGGGAGPAKQAFDALGVSVTNSDGTMKSASTVLGEIAGKFENYRDGAAKTALAVALFGKSGADMIPVLNAGKQGLQESGDEAARYGLVLDKKTTSAAEAFNDNLKRMEKMNEGIIVQITARMLPAFEQLSEAMRVAKENGSLLNTTSDVITGTLKALASVVVMTTNIFKGLATDVVASFNVIKLGIQWKFAEAGEVIENWKKDTAKQVGETRAIMSALWDDVPTLDWSTWGPQLSALRDMNKEVGLIAKKWAETAAPIMGAADATENAVQKFLSSQAKRTAGLLAEAQTVGKSVGEHEKLRIALEAEALAKEKNIPLTDALKQKIAESGDAAAMAAMKVAGANATMQAMNPAQQYAQNMTQLQQLFAAGTISLETYGARSQQIAEQAGATWDIAGASIAGSFATISGAFGKESSAMATAAKTFGIIQGTISMFTGAAKALELPFPANIAAVAAVMAKGASLVASIKSQTIPTGYMTGGSFTVGGGGGADSVPVSFMASPGEQIDVWRPDQGGGSDPRGRSGGGKVFNIGIPLVTTREAIRDLFGLLNDAMADGARLNVVPV